METKRVHKHSRLPRNSRVNDKVIEYYTKFGQDRDLEKFMRLYSPSSIKSRSRSKSTTTSNSCGYSEDEAQCLALKRLFMLNNPDCESVSTSSKSLPSMELGGSDNADCKKMVAYNENEHIVPIHIEVDAGQVKEQVEKCAPEILITPKKLQKSQSKQTQTPDSVAKSHKRLEWDSLGDVGYRKSMSTSNISIVERSLLREFFQEIHPFSISSKLTTNSSEGDLKKLRCEKLVEGKFDAKSNESKAHHTPPLASSTFVDEKQRKAKAMSSSGLSGARPKYTTQGTSTSTSLLKKYEKCVQTTMTNPDERQKSIHSKQIQVNMSSATPSIIGSSATPSSFEYCGSSRSNTTGNIDHHSFAVNITDMLLKRKALKETNNDHIDKNNETSTSNLKNIKNLTESIAEALNDYNKENSTFCAVTKIPQLDLGVQLLCSLIDARSLNKEEKKRLVRDIVKRISHLGGGSEEPSKISSQPNSKIVSSEYSSSSVDASGKGRNKLTKSATGLTAQQSKNSTSDDVSSEHLMSIQDYQEASAPTNAVEKHLKVGSKKQINKKPKPSVQKLSSKTSGEQLDISKTKQPQLQNHSSQKTANKHSVLKNELDKDNKDSLIDTKSHDDKNPKSLQKIIKKQIKSNRKTVSSTSTSSSKDLTTQKEVNNSTDIDATMGEWLNPLTQSEIEYERKKLKCAAIKREKLLYQKKNFEQSDLERKTQLNWIESEIERLESLKNLLQKVDLNDDASNNKTPNQDLLAQKSYDTVHSEKNQDTPSILRESAEHQVQEIELIIEESHEDVVNLEKDLKRTKDRKKETQIVYDRPSKEEEFGLDNADYARFRTMKEIVTVNEEQVLPTKHNARTSAPMQRSKIDTPSSNDSESVCSFVKQRKREFLEHYKNIKKTHYDALLKQQHYSNKHHEHINQHVKSLSPGITLETASGHYSVPQTVQRSYPVQHRAQIHQHFYHHIQPLQPHHKYHHHHLPPRPPPPPPVPPHATYSASAGLTSAQSNSNCNNTNTSSSIFCVSSEMSIPMGSNATSSTTTTHQYDLAAGGVAKQKNDTILHSHPIFGRSQRIQNNVDDESGALSSYASGVSIGVKEKPKSIAYVISFDAKRKYDGSPTTQTTTSKSEETLTLQDYLQRAKPNFCAQAKRRKAILNQIRVLRQERELKLRNIVDNTSINSLDRKLMKLPPPPTKHTRIFATKDMKAMTNKRYALLPEVLDKQEREREDKRKRSNRLLRDLFNRRLQNRVRIGKLSLNHSKTLI